MFFHRHKFAVHRHIVEEREISSEGSDQTNKSATVAEAV